VDDRWVVTHEHHSFADATELSDVAEGEVRDIGQQ